MEKTSHYLEIEQLRRLKIISDLSLGKPDVSALIREAIDLFVEAQAASNPRLRQALTSGARPRLISAAAPDPKILG